MLVKYGAWFLCPRVDKIQENTTRSQKRILILNAVKTQRFQKVLQTSAMKFYLDVNDTNSINLDSSHEFF